MCREVGEQEAGRRPINRSQSRAEGRKRQGRKTHGTKPEVIQQSFSVLTPLEVNSPRNGGRLRPKRQSPEDGGTRWWSKEGGS